MLATHTRAPPSIHTLDAGLLIRWGTEGQPVALLHLGNLLRDGALSASPEIVTICRNGLWGNSKGNKKDNWEGGECG